MPKKPTATTEAPAPKKKNAKPAKPEAAEPKKPRMADMSPAERKAKVNELIGELVSTNEKSEKANVRAKLRLIDHDWRTTYAKEYAAAKGDSAE